MAEEKILMKNKYWLDGIMGLVVGDACGVPVESKSRKELEKNPVIDMREYGTHNQPRGAWSDDSSMALANLKSLHKGYDLADIAEQFSRWDKEEIYTPFGEVFGMGYTCSQGIRNFQDSGNPYTCGKDGERDNGNGSLMRILSMCLYSYEKVKEQELTEKEAVHMIHEVSAITHAHLRSKMACGLYYFCVKAILGQKKTQPLTACLQSGFDEGFSYYRKDIRNLVEIARYGRLSDMEKFKENDKASIKSSGYVLDAFEAAVWSLLWSKDYKSCILKAINLGDDTDTVAAIAGGLAGLYYGYEDIPMEWKNCIVRRKWIEELCNFECEKEEFYSGSVADTHSHFMPGIDDGSESMEMSIEMLHMAEREGVTDIFVTSHGDYVCEEPEHYEETFEKLKRAAEKENIPIRLYKGCEVFHELSTWDFEGDKDDMELILAALDEGIYPTYNGTKYVLTEFAIDIQPAEALYMVKRVQSGGYIPVLAHVERYPFLIREHFVEKLVKEGCLVQINAYSLQEESVAIFRQGARYLLGKGLVHFLGSDAHRSTRRIPRMKKGVQYVWETCDEKYAREVIYQNAYRYFLRK